VAAEPAKSQTHSPACGLPPVEMGVSSSPFESSLLTRRAFVCTPSGIRDKPAAASAPRLNVHPALFLWLDVRMLVATTGGLGGLFILLRAGEQFRSASRTERLCSTFLRSCSSCTSNSPESVLLSRFVCQALHNSKAKDLCLASATQQQGQGPVPGKRSSCLASLSSPASRCAFAL